MQKCAKFAGADTLTREITDLVFSKNITLITLSLGRIWLWVGKLTRVSQQYPGRGRQWRSRGVWFRNRRRWRRGLGQIFSHVINCGGDLAARRCAKLTIFQDSSGLLNVSQSLVDSINFFRAKIKWGQAKTLANSAKKNKQTNK